MIWFKGIPKHRLSVITLFDRNEGFKELNIQTKDPAFFEKKRQYGAAIDFVQRELELGNEPGKALFLTNLGYLSKWTQKYTFRLEKELEMTVDVNASHRELAAMDDLIRTGKGPSSIGIMVKLNGANVPLRFENKALQLYR